jgi:hypothetical protein
MRKGLLAEWRRGIVARGLAAAALLAVPVAVAAAIGFGTSVAGLSEGLDSLATGPDNSQAAPSGPDEIDTAIAAIAAGDSSTAAAQGQAQRNQGVGDTGGDPVTDGGGTDTAPGPAQTPTGGGGSPITSPPTVQGPGADPVNDLVQGLNDALTGLLGGQ